MIAVDTNLLVRWVVGDDEIQVAVVERLFERCEDEGRRVLVTLPVLCELDWVLRRLYTVRRRDAADVYRQILSDKLLTVEDPKSFDEALDRYRGGKGDLADYLIGARGHRLGAATTYTFDRGLRDEEGFTLL